MDMLESALQKKILKKLRLKGGLWYNNHGNPMQARGRLDIQGCYRGRYVTIEVKRPGKDLTPLQALTIQQTRAAGGIAEVAYSVEDALRIIGTVPELE